MKFGSFKYGKRIPAKHVPPANCCKICNNKKEKGKQPTPPKSCEEAPPSPSQPAFTFSIFNFPPNQNLPETPSSRFSIYNFPPKACQPSTSSPYSMFQTTPPGSQQKACQSKYSFFSSPAHNTSLNLYLLPKSPQPINIYEKWTLHIEGDKDRSKLCCFTKHYLFL